MDFRRKVDGRSWSNRLPLKSPERFQLSLSNLGPTVQAWGNFTVWPLLALGRLVIRLLNHHLKYSNCLAYKAGFVCTAPPEHPLLSSQTLIKGMVVCAQ